jgi:hypothetical protein
MKRRNWLYASLALAGGLLGGMMAIELAPSAALAARHSRTVTAEEFVLVSKGGTRRASLGVSAREGAELAMNDSSGHERADFRVTEDGTAQLNFFDQKGIRRVLVGETPKGRNGVAIYSGSGRQIAVLSVAEDNEASLTLYDSDSGRARVGVGMSTKGLPAVVMFDENGHDRAELHVTQSGKAGLAFADENGKTVAGLPAQPQ